MNLDELRSVQSKERQKDSLQHLRDSFYADVAEYVSDRKDARDEAAEQADDPFASPDVRRLTDEIETAEEVAEAIYERRMGKLVKQASLAAAGMSADDEGLTAEERELFSDLVDRIQANKTRVLDVLSGDVEASIAGGGDAASNAADTASPADGTDVPPTGGVHADSAESGVSGQHDPPPVEDEAPAEVPLRDGMGAADVMGEGDPGGPSSEPDDPSADSGSAVRPTSPEETPPGAGRDGQATARTPDDAGSDATTAQSSDDASGEGHSRERVTLRITRDVGEILGVDDREYDLASEDVVSLPAQNAEPLVERDAAEKLE